MTENEAIEVIKTEKACVIRNISGCNRSCEKCDLIMEDKEIISGYDMAISVLEEIQQYRALGTVEEIKCAMKYLRLAKQHGTIGQVIDSCAEYEVLGTVEELREARERQRAKKPKTILRHRGGFEMEHCPNCDMDYQADRRYTINDDYCPFCGKLLDSAFRNFCGNCGQAIEVKRSGEE